jgi:hypothetical protein
MFLSDATDVWNMNIPLIQILYVIRRVFYEGTEASIFFQTFWVSEKVMGECCDHHGVVNLPF